MTLISKVIVSPYPNGAISISLTTLYKAKSTISICAGSLSSSSVVSSVSPGMPLPSPSTTSSLSESTSPPASLSGVSSASLSLSSSVRSTPSSSTKLLISATLTYSSSTPLTLLTIKNICAVPVAPGAIGPTLVR